MFNLYINKICSIFDQSCDPVLLNNLELNCLLWADDLLIVSKTANGLQNSIDKMHQFYSSMGLDVNIKKTKVMIMSKSGRKLDNLFNFKLDGKTLEITNEYQYLGIKLRSSGSFTLAVQELNDKASRAWFAISNIIFKNKRKQIGRIFTLFDSLVTPVATYGSPVWLPFCIPAKKLQTMSDLLDFWEAMKCETINQKCARMTLSVNKNTSRLAVLGELGRYPLFLQSLSQCLSYKLSLFSRKNNNRLISNALSEMETLSKQGCANWLSKVDQISNILTIPNFSIFNKFSGKKILRTLKSLFDIHFLRKINEIKLSDNDGLDHNKLRTYKTLKSSFTREPYLELIRNRNQRCFLTRLRVSSHRLKIELGRHTRPKTPVSQRYCPYCRPGPPPPPPTSPCCSCLDTHCQKTRSLPAAESEIDSEFHFLIRCPMFSADRKCLFERLEALLPNFAALSLSDKFRTLLCPTTAFTTKLIHRFIKNMFACREKYDEEIHVSN